MQSIVDIMDVAAGEFVATVAQYQALARKQVNAKDLAAYVRQVFPAQSAKVARPAAPSRKQTSIALPPVDAPRFSGLDSLFDAIALPLSAQPQRSDVALIEEAGAEILEKITEYVEAGIGSDIPGVRGTMWGAYNAVSEYLGDGRSHRNQSADKKLDSLWFGDAATVNARALDAAIAMSGGRMVV
jgi:hypothetical protein